MADSNSLKVMCIFEAATRLNYSSEVACLAAHIYHRFFRIKISLSHYDLYTFACASINLAHWFYELHFEGRQLCYIMSDIVNGPDFYISDAVEKRLRHSIKLAVKVIFTCLDNQINYKDTRFITPGMLQEHYRSKEAEMLQKKQSIIELSDEESSSSEEEDAIEKKEDRLLAKNDKHSISSHRYLVHYLKVISELVAPESLDTFAKISNLAWTFLNDYHWSPCVTQLYSNHLACACLMIAIEVYRPRLADSRLNVNKELWKVLDKKWNLILCDDFNSNVAAKAILSIVEQYQEYERLQQHELSLFVIDPLRR